MARGTTNSTSRRNKSISYSKWGYIFVAPFCIVYLIFSLYPLISTFIYSTANMKANTAEFWGFGDKEVYYDRYLDLTALYTDKDTFAERTGVDYKSYKRVRDYFDKFQKSADTYNPLKESGVNAIVDYAANPSADDANPYSAEAAAAVKAAYDAQDFGPILENDYYDQLVNWSSTYKNETILNQNTVGTLVSKTDAIVNTDDSSEDSETTTTTTTAEDIITSDDFVTFVESLDTTEFNAGQVALLNYLSSYVSEQLGKDYTIPEFFKAIQSGDISLDDPTVYYVCSRLDKTSIDFAEEGAEEKAVSKISVPFLGTLEKFLTPTWKETILALSSYSNFSAYSTGEKDLHEDQEQLLADMKTLNAMGIVDLETLVKDGDAIKPSDDYLVNKLVAYQQFIDKNYQANPTATLAAMQVAAIKNFKENTQDAVKGFEDLGISIYAMISYQDDVNVEKYNQVKATLGLTESLSLKAYEQIDANRKAENVEKGKALLEEKQALLPDAQAAYDAVKDSGDDKAVQAALESLRSVEVQITKAEDMIDNPDGVLSKVAAKDFYILTGVENYSQIFNNRSRLNTVIGAFVSTAIMWLIGFAPQILLALILSAWFTDTKLRLKGLGLMKALMYLPNVITSVTIAIFFRRLFIYSSGGSLSASQILLRACGMENGYNFFESGWATRFIICFINFWMWYGNTMIVLIAGITSINTSLYEAAQIDGADSFQTYTKITMPLLRPILLYTLVTSLIGGLQMFDIPQNINRSPALMNFNGTMIQSTRTVMMYINTQAFGTQQNKQVGIASAISVLLFISTTILSILIFYLMRDKDAAKARKLKKQGGKK